MIGSFLGEGGGVSKKLDFRLKCYEIRVRCYEFITLEMNKLWGWFYSFWNIYQLIICIFPVKCITHFSIVAEFQKLILNFTIKLHQPLPVIFEHAEP